MGNKRLDSTSDDGISLDSLPKLLRDKIDYDNEVAGRETGRARRFLSSDRDHDADSQAKKEERRFNALLRLLQDPNYARLYSQAANAVTNAEEATNRALRKLDEKAELASQSLNALRDKALELPDGRKVFRAKDGRFLTEDGKDVSDQRGALKGSLEDAPSYEEFKHALETLQDIQRRQRELERYKQDVLNPFKDRLSDTDNPPSEDELHEMIERTEAMPPDARAELASSKPFDLNARTGTQPSAASEYVAAAELNAPDMDAHFRAAANGSFEDPYASPKATVTPKAV